MLHQKFNIFALTLFLISNLCSAHDGDYSSDSLANDQVAALHTTYIDGPIKHIAKRNLEQFREMGESPYLKRWELSFGGPQYSAAPYPLRKRVATVGSWLMAGGLFASGLYVTSLSYSDGAEVTGAGYREAVVGFLMAICGGGGMGAASFVLSKKWHDQTQLYKRDKEQVDNNFIRKLNSFRSLRVVVEEAYQTIEGEDNHTPIKRAMKECGADIGHYEQVATLIRMWNESFYLSPAYKNLKLKNIEDFEFLGKYMDISGASLVRKASDKLANREIPQVNDDDLTDYKRLREALRKRKDRKRDEVKMASESSATSEDR